MESREEVDTALEALRYLMDSAASYLSPEREAACATLLWNDEPNEALPVIAWELAPRFGELPEPIVRFVKEAVGDSRDPPEFRSDN